jgi:ArsR family transcriptional regulator
MTKPHTDRFAAALKAVSDPARRRILALLKKQGCCSIGKGSGMCACDVEQQVRLSQPTISHHMRILTAAGLVEQERVGQWRWYRRNDAAIRELLQELKEGL